ncbi:MAG TPA: hypothetical protein VE954_32510 [Oligoflexus sp.]|uniref:hypothetical protein n=1 Tax=Oligoflexus sp. TaxID=1971216 RepID=UPI002D3CC995|nr:hypothetical protein [Oligoflexus sp.]HYX37851.1 hypothetical protein [Oligoflexus sp.]
MHKLWFVGLTLLGLQSAAQAQQDPDAGIKAEAVLFDLEAYRNGLSLGRMDGGIFFEGYFIRDCTFLTLNSTAVTHWIEYVNTVLERPLALSYFDQGYRSGWVMGYLRAYHRAYDVCQQELNETIRIALGQRLEQCRSLALDASQNLIVDGIMDLIPAHALRPEDAEELLGMVYFGSRSEAWRKLMAFDNQFISALPCAAVMMDAIKVILQERIQSR